MYIRCFHFIHQSAKAYSMHAIEFKYLLQRIYLLQGSFQLRTFVMAP